MTLDRLDTLPDKKEELQNRFLTELGDEKVAGNVLVACRRVGVPRATVYFWKANDSEFAKKWSEIVMEAQDTFIDEAEYALRNQVLKGNVSAIMFVLKKLKPEKWGDKGFESETQVTHQHLHKVSPRFANVLREMYPEGKIVST